ncbi:hypothetical protein [Bacillus massilinigeriensis]|uniref:hypothetical protein n=1 Tax=Bacillus mediterraneensis TaxID=1805474 RepID=UPI0008F88659|nr:hypothetical protein [Bacillus mediterraneensis]
MFTQSLLAILKLKTAYFLSRKLQFFEKAVSKLFRIKKVGNGVSSIFLIWNLFQYGLYFVIVFFGYSKLKVYFSSYEILHLFFFFIFINAIISGFTLIKYVISPVEETLLSLSPLSNRQIYFFTWISNYTINILPNYIYIILTFFVINKGGTLLSWGIFILYLLFANICSFILTIIGAYISINRITKGFRFSTFIINLFWGSLILAVSYWISKSVIYWMINKPNLLSLGEWKGLITVAVKYFKELLIYKEQFSTPDVIFSRILTNHPFSYMSMAIWVSILVILLGWCITKAGFWYRTSWKHKLRTQRDWLDILEIAFSKFIRSTVEEIQIKNLFRNREQLSQNISFFFFHYTNYMFIGMALGFAALIEFNGNPMFRLIGLTFLFNSVSRDSFESGNTLFPGIFNFDADGKSVLLYRLSGVTLEKLYDAKVKLQRIFGVPEFMLMFIVFFFILDMNFVELLYVSSICILNIVCIPELKMLPSYMSPHLDFQHYTEIEEYTEREAWGDTVESKLVQFLMFIVFLPPIGLLLLDIEANLVYIICTSVIFIATLIIYQTIKYFKQKITIKVNRMDL